MLNVDRRCVALPSSKCVPLLSINLGFRDAIRGEG
jgi:hypothetical protein